MARPKIEIDADKVRELASQGLSERQIAHCLGINWKTLAARKRESAKFMELLEQGKAEGIQQIANAMFQTALGGHFQAQQFFLCNRDRDGWRHISKAREEENDQEKTARLLADLIERLPN